MAEHMTKRERVAAALRGAEVDRVPIAFWGHFASDPRTADDLVPLTLDFQRRFDWDFVKLMPSGMYFPQAYGCELTPAGGPTGTNSLSRSVVQGPSDWARLPVLDPATDWLAQHVRTVGMVREEMGPDVPIIQSLFSPLTVAHKMSLDRPFNSYVREHVDELSAGLARIAESTIRFAEASLDAGADGFFFATQDASPNNLTEAEFQAFGRRFDLQVLNALGDRAWFNLLHVCRENIVARWVADYPVPAVNWDSHQNAPSFVDGPRVWPQAVVGGVDRYGVIVSGSPADVESEVRRAIETVGGRHMMVSAGCGLPLARPDANLDAARRAVDPNPA